MIQMIFVKVVIVLQVLAEWIRKLAIVMKIQIVQLLGCIVQTMVVQNLTREINVHLHQIVPEQMQYTVLVEVVQNHQWGLVVYPLKIAVLEFVLQVEFVMRKQRRFLVVMMNNVQKKLLIAIWIVRIVRQVLGNRYNFEKLPIKNPL